MREIMELLQSTSIHLVVVCLAIYAIARLGFRAYENTFQKEGVSERCQTMKIHLLYIAGILLFIIIEVASYLAIKSDPRGESLMQYISFASTLASIILSILAIILTIVTTSKGDSTILKVEQATEKLEETLLKLKNVSEQYDEKIETLYQNLQNANETIKNTSDEIKITHNKLEELKKDVCENKDEIISRLGNSIDQLKGGNITLGDSQAAISVNYRKLIQTASFLGNLGLLACYISLKKKKSPFPLRKINEEWEKYIAGYLVALSTTQMIDIEIEANLEVGLLVKVTDIHQDVSEKEIRENLNDYISRPSNNEHIEKNRAALSAIDQYFDGLE